LETVQSIRPFLAVLVSLIATALIIVSGKRPNLRESWSVGAGVVKFLLVISMAPTVLAGGRIDYTLYTFFPGIDIKFHVDALGLLFGTIASFLWIVTSFYSIGYMRTLEEHAQTRYYACFALSLASAVGIAFSANLLTLFLFYELLSLVTYPLVAHKETEEAFAGGQKYMVYLLGTSKTFLLSAIILTFIVAGTLDFSPHGLFSALTVENRPVLLVAIYILFIAGFAKAGIMPFHSWLPAAMVAPTPVSALLHAVAVVNTGVFCVLRVIFNVFGVDAMQHLNLGVPTAFFVSFTILMASVYALTRDNLKARLAYSTVSQLSYMVLGAALLTPSSMVGGIIHIANHAFSKITLFFCAGSIYAASHKTNISEMRGIGRKMPWTMSAFAVATLSMIGVPPVAGFVTKWYLAVGSIEAKQIPILFVLLASTILNAAYFLPIVYNGFFADPQEDPHHQGKGGGEPEIREASYFVVVPLLITAVLSVVIGIYPDYFLNLAREAIR
jgi:multicomponent Na+:H+ antiporter subunit D